MHAQPDNIINRACEYSAIYNLFRSFWHYARTNISFKG